MLLDQDRDRHNLLIWLAIAFILHLGLIVLPYVFWTDMDTFKRWALGLVQHGLPNFYDAIPNDYPPGYMYVLWLTGKFYTLFGTGDQTLLMRLVKLVPAIADLGSAWMIWLILAPLVSKSTARIATLLYTFNPVPIFVSAVWGQIDSVVIFLMLVVMWLLQQNRFAIAGLIGAISVIVKPQGLFLLPIFMLSQWYKRTWQQWAMMISVSIVTVWLMILPFVWSRVDLIDFTDPNSWLKSLTYPLRFLYDRFVSGATLYPLASLNAFNIWSGVNWLPDNAEIWGLSYRSIGLGLLSVVVVWIGIFLRKHPDGIFLAAAVVMMAIFMLPTRMHERYIFYVIPFMAVAATLRPTLCSIYLGVALTSAINIGYSFMKYNQAQLFNLIPVNCQQILILMTAITNLGLLLALIYHTIHYNQSVYQVGNQVSQNLDQNLTQKLTQNLIRPQVEQKQQSLWLWLAIAFVLHLGFMVLPYAFWIDMGTFRAWAMALVERGIPNFYGSLWSDYPPGYMYVLWLTGQFYALFDPYLQHTDQTLLITLVKLVPAIADIASAFLIWLIMKPLTSPSVARTAALIYAFNPVTIFISAVWGQIDSVIVLLMLVVVWLLTQDKFAIAGIIGAVSVIVKPQGLFLFPIFVLGQWYRRTWGQWLSAIAGGFLAIWLMVLPFVWLQITPVNFSDPSSLLATVIYPLQFLYKQFMAGAAIYPYASVNAFNIWAVVNWQPDGTEIWGLSYRLIGLGLLAAVLVWIGIFLRKHPDGIFLATAVVMMAMFMFPTRIHERYIFYAIAFWAMASALRPTLRPLYWGLTITSAINITYVFARYNHEEFFNSIPAGWQQSLILLTAIANLSLFLVLLSHTIRYDHKALTLIDQRVKSVKQQFSQVQTNQSLSNDYLQLSIPYSDDHDDIDHEEKATVAQNLDQLDQWDLTHWQLIAGSLVIFAIALGFRLWHLDAIPTAIFDEVYFPKFAAQYIDGNPEWEGHPPLGKYIIALGITIFGRNAIGDRITEALFGSLLPVLLIGLVYLLTSRRSQAILAGGFLAMDGLFLVESRLSLINVFLVGFGLSSQIFLLAGLKQKGNSRTLMLALAGIMLGAAASVKWNGLGFLLMVVLLMALVWAVALLFPKKLSKLGILAEIRSLHWWQYLICLIIMPTLMYVGQWVPHLIMNSGNKSSFWESLVAVHGHIIWWHNSAEVVQSTSTKPVHPYCSTWFSWPVMARSIGYYFNNENNIVKDIHALGNPILWWLSTISIVGLSVWGLRRLQGVTAYILIGYAANYLPWAIAKRCLFVYHYMSALTFSFMGLALITDLLLRQKQWRWLGVAIIIAVLTSYCFFLPIWLGLPISTAAFYQRMWFMPGGIGGFNWI